MPTVPGASRIAATAGVTGGWARPSHLANSTTSANIDDLSGLVTTGVR